MEKVGSGRIHLDEPVEAVDQTEETVVVTTKNNNSFHCKRLIVAVPPSQIGWLL